MSLRVPRALSALLLGLPLMAQSAPTVEQRSQPASHTASATLIPADIPVRRDGPAEGYTTGNLAFALWSALVLGALVWIVVSRYRKAKPNANLNHVGRWRLALQQLMGSAARPEDLQVLGSARLGPRHSVHAVAWQGKQYLVGCSEHGLSLLDSDSSPPPASEHTAS